MDTSPHVLRNYKAPVKSGLAKDPGSIQQYACPYDTRIFQSEEDLWRHVSGDHAQLLDELGIKGDTALYRKLLRKEAVDKA